MSFIEWLLKGHKALSSMDRAELRRQELLLEKDRNQMLKKVQKLAGDKQVLFQKGAGEKTPEIRRALAQEFELKTTEQLMLARQLNIRTKEMITVSRLRMLRENQERARNAGSHLGLISEKDMLTISKLIENDAISAELYQERLDQLMSLGREVDEGAAGISKAGQEVLNIWDKMDNGVLTDAHEAFDEADRRVREKHKTPEEA
ncbi:MAG: hypothetical protein HJJLKODD_00343 [Phycisphaerae bacterium]|nr:hypothetical protein [Phycisphaerae bacterium]